MLEDGRIAELSRALGHPARVQIVRMLAAQPECAGADIFSGVALAQSTISEHLRVLKEAGLVKSRSVGPRMVYCVNAGVLTELGSTVLRISSTVPDCTSTEGNRKTR